MTTSTIENEQLVITLPAEFEMDPPKNGELAFMELTQGENLIRLSSHEAAELKGILEALIVD